MLIVSYVLTFFSTPYYTYLSLVWLHLRCVDVFQIILMENMSEYPCRLRILEITLS